VSETALTWRDERQGARELVHGAGRGHERVGQGSDGKCGDRSGHGGEMCGEFEGSGEENGCGACRGSGLEWVDGPLEGGT
jgi:hypothetical protein